VPGSRAVAVPGEAVYLFGERGSAALPGPLYERLAPFLDGTHTIEDVVGNLSATASAAEIYFAIDQLVARGYVCDGDRARPEAAAAFWRAQGLDPVDALARLRASRVEVKAVGAIDLAPLAGALGGAGLTVAPGGAATIVATDDYLRPELADVNAAALASRRPWLLCKPVGSVLWIGPLFRPGASACWACLAHRLRDNRAVEAEVQARAGTTDPLVPPTGVPASEAIALGLAALWVAREIASPAGDTTDAAVVTLDLQTLATVRHVLARRPQCERCGQPLDPDRAPQAPRFDGGRAVPPEVTFARYRRHVSPITGFVSELEAVSTGPIHVWRNGGGTAWGKGTTAEHARTAALGEALEMASGRFLGDEARERASYRSLGARAIHPNACMLFSDRQYERRQEWNAEAGWFRHIPQPFDEDEVIDWVHAWSLTNETFRLLPAEYCFYGHPSRPARALADPNGQGAGHTIEDAILHGLLELVERDAAAIWWGNRIRRPAVDVESVDDPVVRAVRAHAIREGREVWALDVTSDLGIPVFAAVSRACDGPERISFGFGVSFDPRVALVRALAEMHQLARTMIEAKDRRLRQWWQSAAIAGHPYLAPETGAMRSVRDPLRAPEIDTVSAIGECRRRLEQQGLETFVIDQTRPDIGLPTVRVVVPGLRHWRPPRHAPGRLYDVPVRLGWLARPLREDELNPSFPPA
jgi:ribosomal protein S12 methylthiotransferase accessory factor